MNSPHTTAEQWSRFWFFQKLEFWLDPIPRKRRRAIISELDENLTEAADINGMRSALDELGNPRELAKQYLEQEPAGRPNWGIGVLAASIVLALWVLTTLVYALGMMAALESTGAPRAESTLFGVRLITEFTSASIGVEFAGFAWPAIALAALAFLLFSSYWRVFTGKRRFRAAVVRPVEKA